MANIITTLLIGLVTLVLCFAIAIPIAWVGIICDERFSITPRLFRFLESHKWIGNVGGVIFILFMLLAIGAAVRSTR